MTDVATGFLQGVAAFGATQLGKASSTTFHDAGSLTDSLTDDVPNNTKSAFDKLKKDIKDDKDLVEPIINAIKKQTDVIGKMATDSIADAKASDFTVETAGRIATRIGTALLAMDEAVRIIARELSKDSNGHVQQNLVDGLMAAWNPWVKPFQDLADGVGKVVDSLGDQLLGVSDATQKLGQILSWDQANFRLAAQLASVGEQNYGVMRLDETKLEAFLGFKRREFVNPTEADKAELVERDGKWYRADEAVFGLRLYTLVKPGLQNDPLLKKIMPGSKDPKTIDPTAVTLDSIDGLYLGDGRGAGNERAVLPIMFSFPAVEIREVALGIVRNDKAEVTGLEVTMLIDAKLGDAVGLQIGGVGVTIGLDGEPTSAAMFPMVVSPRWPDRIGLRVKAGPIKGGGYFERVVRTYGTGDNKQEIVEFGGVIQLEILKAGVYAIGILSPEPFSMVLVMGLRFPTPIQLSFGFTFNGVGGILALDRTVDTGELLKGMEKHILDRVLFPDDPVAEAPTLLNQVAKVFPPRDGGFVVGPIVELGWGSQAKFVQAKLGVVLSLPDPKILILGAVRIRAVTDKDRITDLRCEVFGEITGDHLLIIASLRNSKIFGIGITGDLGLLIQWGGGGAFALTIGGFNPRYKAIPPELNGMKRLTIDLSPGKAKKKKDKMLTITVEAYFAVTAGAVMLGVKGDLKADIKVASAHAWLQLDMIFYWVPHVGFAVDVQVGIVIEVFGASFASILFKGSLEGTRPWRIYGTATIDVWFLPTFHFDLGPVEWGPAPSELPATASPLTIVAQALNEDEAWKAVLPLDGDLLVGLAPVDVEGLVAHPLAALEVTQSVIPLETHIDRIGSAGVSAHRVNLELPTTSAGAVGAVSTVTAAFAPGQFLAIEGEALLARAGFDALPSGCRMAAATTPVAGTPESRTVRWKTYIREDTEPDLQAFKPAMFAELLVGHSAVGRVLAERENPYLPRSEKVNPDPARRVSMREAGASRLHSADDGGEVLADLGVLGATEAAWVAERVTQSGEAEVVSATVGAL